VSETKPIWAPQDAVIKTVASQNPTFDVSKAVAKGIAIAEASIGIMPVGDSALTGIALAQARKAKDDRQNIYDDGAGNVYGYEKNISYFTDYAGEESSAYIFHHTVWMLGILDEPTHRALVERRTSEDFYNTRLGAFTRRGTVTVTIAQLKELLANRIAELKVDQQMIEKWNDTPSESPVGANAWLSQDFETRMQTFRKSLVSVGE
jgi:hypothetical protein